MKDAVLPSKHTMPSPIFNGDDTCATFAYSAVRAAVLVSAALLDLTLS